jgi:hypothetical protein
MGDNICPTVLKNINILVANPVWPPYIEVPSLKDSGIPEPLASPTIIHAINIETGTFTTNAIAHAKADAKAPTAIILHGFHGISGEKNLLTVDAIQ